MSDSENKKGFAGLSSLESSVAPVVSDPVPEEKIPETNNQTQSTSHSAPPPITKVEPKFTYSPELDFIKKRWLWIVIGIVLIYAFASGDDKNASKTSSSSPSSSYSSNYGSDLTESMPSYGSGSGHVLGASEIYYCLAEAIRIDANRGTLNQYDGYSIDRFNNTVNDFNARCSDYRYRSSAMSSANRAIEANRYLIEAQGRARN